LPTVVAVLRKTLKSVISKMPGIVLKVFLRVKVLIIALFVDKQQTARVSRQMLHTQERQFTYAVKVVQTHIMKTRTNIQRLKSPGRAIEQHLQKRKSNVEKVIIKKP
jgi:hypothetical protein